jgi:hypothetical protein
MRLGSETGSLINHFLAKNIKAPEAGMGATVCGWTDRYPATIVKVTRTQVHIQYDNYKRTDNNGICESQDYEYSPNPKGSVVVFRMTKRGLRDTCGNYLSVGERERYFDFSF